MESAFNGDALLKRLKQLRDKQQLAFGASCCDRLLPNYLAFQNDTGWGDIEPLQKALDLVWSFLEGQSYSADNIRQLAALCENVAPDSEDFTSLYVSFAQDACFAICGLLDFLLVSDARKIVQAATYAMSSVDLYVQEIENMESNAPDLEQKILAHPLMQRELKKQREDFENIAQAPILNADFLVHLRNSWGNSGKSNLDLP